MKRFFTLIYALLAIFTTNKVYGQSPGAALNFNGAAGNFVSGPGTGLPLGNSPRTMELWVNWNPSGGGTYMLAGWGGGGLSGLSGSDLYISNGYVYLWGTGTYWVAATSRVPENTWTHVAMTWDGTTLQFYINGSPAGTYTSDPATSQPIVFNTTLTYGLDIGRGINGVADYYYGSFDELRVWNGVRTQAQIGAYMNCEINDAPCELKANFHFNQGVAGGDNTSPAINTLDDQSANNIDGTLYNFSLNGATSNWITPGGVTTGTSCTAFPPAPEINVQGNSTTIVDGDNTPSTADNTDFGNVSTSGNSVKTYTIQNTGAGSLTVSNITMSGTNAFMFTVGGITLPTTVAAGSSTTFTVTFAPTSTGTKTAAVNIANNDCDEGTYDFAVQGTGATAPSFSACPSNQSANTASGQCTAAITYTATATGSPTPTFTYAFTGATTASGSGTGSGSTFNKGVTNVVITASNGVASDATCSFTVTVIDNIPPTITCAANVTINTIAGQCTGTTILTAPTVTDNCQGVNNALQFNSGGNVAINFTWPANTAQPMTMEWWANITSTGLYRMLEPVSPNNNFGQGGTSRFTILSNGANLIVHYGGTSMSFNAINTVNTWAHFAVSWNPVGGQANMYVNGVLVRTIGFTAAPDGVITGLNLKEIPGTLDEFRIWTTARTQAQIQANMNKELTGTEAGLFLYYNFNQGVAGGNNTSITTITDAAGADNNGTLGGFTKTGNVSNFITSGAPVGTIVTNNAPSTYPKGNTTVTWTATDASGNTATCNQTVTVVDNQAPTLVSPGNQTLVTTTGACTATYTIADPVTDNCTGSSWGYSTTGATMLTSSGNTIADGTGSGTLTFNKGVTTVTLTGIDNSANAATNVSFTVTVNDNQAPTLTCPGNQTINVIAGSCAANYTIADPISDNCTGATWGYTLSGATTATVTGIADGAGSGSLSFNKGVTTVTLSGTDGTNSATGCSFTVTVVDNQAPTLTCPGNQTMNVMAGSCAANYTIADPISDNCTGATWGYTLTGATTGTVTGIADGTGSGSLSFNKGVTTVTLSGTDGTNSATGCSFTVTVNDNIAPVITCAANVTINTSPGQCTGTTTLPAPTVSDNCGGTVANNGLDFDGTNDVVIQSSSPFTPGTSDFTYETWIYPRSFTNAAGTAAGVIWARDISGDANNQFRFFFPTSGKLQLDMTEVSTSPNYVSLVSTSGAVSLNTWTHVAVVRQGATHYLYINGVLNASAVSTQSTVINCNPTTQLRLGGRVGNNWFTGKMDEFRTWNTARTQSQIQSLMNSELTGNEAGLVQYYKLNESSGTTAVATKGSNGSLSGFALSGSTSNWTTGNVGTTYPIVTNNAPSTYPIGNTTVIWTATDASGNTATCNQTITVVAPEINVQGNSTTIMDGDGTPSATDRTDFGDVPTGSNAVRTYTIQNTGTSNLNVGSITSTGTNATEFVVAGITPPATITAGTSATFTVTFSPTATGNRTATIHVNSNDCDESDYDYAVQGNGIVPVSITSFTPTTAATGTTVTITGTGFTGATAVSFGSTAASSFNVVNSTTITAVVGPGATGSVSVTTPNGSPSLAGFTYCIVTAVSDPTGNAYCQNAVASAMRVSATGSGILAYQWYSNATNTNTGGTAIGGATSNSYTPLTTTAGTTYYYATVSGDCGTATSRTAAIVVNALPALIATSLSSCDGSPINLNNGITSNTTGFTVTFYSDAALAMSILPTVTSAGTYYVKADNGQCYNSATVTASFGIPPALTAQDINTGCNADNTDLDNGIISDVTGLTVTYYSDGACTNAISNIVNSSGTYYVQASNGICYSRDSIRVGDLTPPIITCPNSVTAMLSTAGANPGCARAVALDAPSGISDNCGTPTLTWISEGSTPGSGTGAVPLNQVFNIGRTKIYYTVTDANGNSTTCSTIVAVVDDIYPVIVAPPVSTTIGPDAGMCTATVSFPTIDVSDNCGIKTVRWILSGATSGSGDWQSGAPVPQTLNAGTTRVKYTVTDNSGNMVPYSYEITVADNNPPAISGVSDISNNLVAGCSMSITVPNPVVSDVCSGVASVIWKMTGATSGSSKTTGINYVGMKTFNSGVTTVTYTAKDGLGNTATQSFTVTVIDAIAPTISCPSSISDVASATSCSKKVAVPNATTSDNCKVALLTWVMTGATTLSSPATGINQVGSKLFNTGVTTVTYTVGDAAGNTGQCSFTVTITDNTPPVVQCPANKMYMITSGGDCFKNVAVNNPVITDNCGVASYSYDMSGATTKSGDGFFGTQNFNIGVTTITYTATDVNGNQSSCSFTVTVKDAVKPVFTNCGSAITATTTSGCDMMVSIPDKMVNDDCSGIASLAWVMTGATTDQSPAMGINQVGSHPFGVGLTTIIYTATDGAGNVATCKQTVTIKDPVKPSLSGCPLPFVSCKTSDNTYTIPATLSGSDNCTPANTLTATYAITGATIRNGTGYDASGLYNVGVSTVKWTVKDGSGNASTCTMTVTISPTPCGGMTRGGPVTQVAEANSTLKALLYPNPTTAHFALQVKTKTREAVEVNVYNAKGQKVEGIKAVAGETLHFGESYQAGTYMIEVKQGSERVTVTGVKSN